MFDNTNPYTLRTEVVEGITRYYVSFKDGPRSSRRRNLRSYFTKRSNSK